MGEPPMLRSEDMGEPPMLRSEDMGEPPMLRNENMGEPPMLRKIDATAVLDGVSVRPTISRGPDSHRTNL
jgi:hypothetical protein